LGRHPAARRCPDAGVRRPDYEREAAEGMIGAVEEDEGVLAEDLRAK